MRAGEGCALPTLSAAPPSPSAGTSKPCLGDCPLGPVLAQATGSPLQALGMFSAALASGQLGPLMCQFGLPAEAVEAANKGGEYLLLCPLLGTAFLC